MQRSMVVAVAMLAALLACDDPVGPGTSRPWGPGQVLTGGGGAGGDTGTVATVTVAPTGAVLAVGDSIRLVASALDQGGVGVPTASFTWTSSDVRIVRVRPDPATRGVAVVVGIALGSATVTVNSGAATASATLTVVSQP